MPAADTIAAVATPPGRGAIGIVRVSGPSSRAIAEHLIGSAPAPGRATYRTFRNAAGEVLDRGLALFFAGPRSFTGEDSLELHAHGGPAVVRGLLDAVLFAGARLARPGEFSERAFLNGKLDLVQAEAVADLIASTTGRAARAAARSLTGDFSARVATAQAALEDVRMRIEAAIDFADEGLSVHSNAVLMSGIDAVIDALSAMCLEAAKSARLQTGLDVAIVGAPNTGKSTLLNALAGEERAIVSARAGTTRDIVSVDLDIEGLPVRAHDTAGLREAGDEIEIEGVRRALARLRDCDVVLQVVDAALTSPGDVPAPAGFDPVRQRRMLVWNKIDLTGAAARCETAHDGCVLWIAARSRLGLDSLRGALLDMADVGGNEETTFLARARHVEQLRLAEEALRGIDSNLLDTAPELAAEHLRNAQRALSELTGEYTTEDLLGAIFSRFCIGK